MIDGFTSEAIRGPSVDTVFAVSIYLFKSGEKISRSFFMVDGSCIEIALCIG